MQGRDSCHLHYSLSFLPFFSFFIFPHRHNLHEERRTAAVSLVLARQLRCRQDDTLWAEIRNTPPPPHTPSFGTSSQASENRNDNYILWWYVIQIFCGSKVLFFSSVSGNAEISPITARPGRRRASGRLGNDQWVSVATIDRFTSCSV